MNSEGFKNKFHKLYGPAPGFPVSPHLKKQKVEGKYLNSPAQDITFGATVLDFEEWQKNRDKNKHPIIFGIN